MHFLLQVVGKTEEKEHLERMQTVYADIIQEWKKGREDRYQEGYKRGLLARIYSKEEGEAFRKGAEKDFLNSLE